MKNKETIYNIKSLLAKDEVHSSLNKLLEFIEIMEQEKSDSLTSKFKNQLIVLSANLNRISHAFTIGLIDWNKQSEEKNKLVFSLLTICDVIEDDLHSILNSKFNQMTSGLTSATHKISEINTILNEIAK